MARQRIFTGLACLAVVGGLAAFEVASPGNGALGERAPALPTQTVRPTGVTLTSLRGEPAAINFWASWCTPCRREAPELESLNRDRTNPGRIIGVNWNDRLSSARAFVRDHRLTFPNLRDADGSIGRAYGMVGLPTTVILNSRGRIAAVLSGPQTAASVRIALESAG